MEGGTNRVLASDRIKNGAHPTRRADAAAKLPRETMLTATRNEQIDNYNPTDNSQPTGKISTECHNVGAGDQRISRRDRNKPLGIAHGGRGNVRAKCGPKPTRNDPQKEAIIIPPRG
ncbi:unnamed protein product [Echinostoma caproni]|uniref:Uncharacterized protein n=1 Tax=Echinostoma caproni TaxID=27848 RepID=A0A183AY31_9TREM|nr:unnamed protein product [Echinostoma caproni]